MAPVVFVQWSFVTFHCIFIPNPWCSSNHAYKPITLSLKHGSSPPTATPPTTCREATVASVRRLSGTPRSEQGTNLLRHYRCYRLTFVSNSFKRNQQLVKKLPYCCYHLTLIPNFFTQKRPSHHVLAPNSSIHTWWRDPPSSQCCCFSFMVALTSSTGSKRQNSYIKYLSLFYKYIYIYM
jgi:hypothetical protein